MVSRQATRTSRIEPRYLYISREFIKRGYAVVIPMRMGFGQSGGNYTDRECDMERNGEAQAGSLYFRHVVGDETTVGGQEHVLIGGQSHGGLTAIAAGSHNIAGVKGIINFAGGLPQGQRTLRLGRLAGGRFRRVRLAQHRSEHLVLRRKTTSCSAPSWQPACTRPTPRPAARRSW